MSRCKKFVFGLVFALSFFLSLKVEARSFKILLFEEGWRPVTYYDIYSVSTHLNATLAGMPGYEGSTCVVHRTAGNSLLDAWYSPNYTATTHSVLSHDYDAVIFFPMSYYMRDGPEAVYEALLHLSDVVLNNGGKPMLMLEPSPNSVHQKSTENTYRVANGCGIHVMPGGTAAKNATLLGRQTGINLARQSYLLSSTIFTYLSGKNATESSYIPLYSGSPLDASNLAAFAENTLAVERQVTHYSTGRETSGSVQYRTKDVSQAPFNGTARFLYKGTSTENGFRGQITPILQAMGFAVDYTDIGDSQGGTKFWTGIDTTNAFPWLDARQEQVLFAFARGATSDGNLLVNNNQSNLLPLVFDRHYDSIGSGAQSIYNVMDDIHWANYYRMVGDNFYDNFSCVPFHIGASRFYKADQTIIASVDGVHATTPLNIMMASMFVTSALGTEPTPSAQALANAQNQLGFNLGYQIIKELAFLSETMTYMPDSSLDIVPMRPPVCTTRLSYNHVLKATNGIPPFTWREISNKGLPAGLSLSSNGVVSGVATGTPGVYTLVLRVADSTGSIRKAAVKLLLQDISSATYSSWADYMFENACMTLDQKSASGNPDQDNQNNLFEFATGGNPLRPDQMSIEGSLLNHSNYTVHYYRRGGGNIQPSGEYRFNQLSYSVEQCINLKEGVWQGVGTNYAIVTRDDMSNSYEKASMTFSSESLSPNSRHYRLKIDFSE